jgi:hypothetical protein
MALGCSFPLFPLYPNESPLLELGFYSAGMAVLLLVDLVGRIGTVGNMVDLDRMDEYGKITIRNRILASTR